ncbi:nucleoside recognition domain-containing protein [Halobacillus kuroshimensis]|uniref:Nucleoside recognition domain-containing protein n=1 Tax=Halobacillus kuroshimensis TaxID=302481 RepID=A0ABS3DVM2_9BACI|nr:nucleoside recognition domain-containing protein [Halobacillus kuroshimensis]MBN8235386.1 nucleoside recognition domain-containing protein [Halobacillus kuroshimensis]
MKGTLLRGGKKGLDLTWTLGKVIFPVTLIVTILQYTPVLPWVMDKLEPLMGWLGLPGQAAVPLVVGNFLNLYAGIAAILSFDFTVKEVFILAVMLSFSHNLLIESTVAKKVGVSWWIVIGVRLSLAFFSAFIIHLFWDGGGAQAKYGLAPSNPVEPEGWTEIVIQGVQTAGMGIIQLAFIVIPLMVVMQFMREKGWLDKFSEWVAPCTRFLGMERNTSMTLAAGLTIGLAYGAGLMIQAVEEDGVSKKDMYLAVIFLVACHAVVEDTLVFIPLGIPVWPLLIIRLTTAVLLTAAVGFVWNKLQHNRKDTSHEHTYHSL